MIERLEYIDTIRVFACFLVILTHSVMPSIDGSDGAYIYGFSFFCFPCVGLFFAISGALIIPVKVNMKEFYKRRFKKIIPPLIIWSLIGVTLESFIGRLTISESINKFLRMPFEPIVGVYWFMYVMIGLYMIAPVISKWLKDASKRELQFMLLIWGLTLLYPYANLIFGTNYFENGSHYNTLNYFGGFLGYWFLGYYLLHYPIKIGWNSELITVLLIFSLYLIYNLFEKLSGHETGYLIGNLQIGNAIMVAIIFILIQNIYSLRIFNKADVNMSNWNKTVSEIAKYSFGIYLVHIWVARDLVWPIFYNYYRPHVLIQAPISALLTLIISYLIIKTISKLPYSKYIIGV